MFKLKDFQNNETSKNLKYSEKEKNKTIVARMVPPPNMSTPDSFVVTQSNQVTELRQPQRNPIRHYRRQLVGSNSANILIQPAFDVPGDSIVKTTENCPTCTEDSPLLFSESIYPNDELTKCIDDCTGYQSSDPTLWKYTCCRPENNVIKTASTNLSKKYSTSNRDYLKNRGKTFKNNLYSENITQNSRDCNIYNINNVNNNGNTSVTATGNIDNNIGGTAMSAYIYKRSFRNISNNSINNNGLCCPEYPGTVLYKNNNNVCKVNDYPNLSRRQILCKKR